MKTLRELSLYCYRAICATSAIFCVVGLVTAANGASSDGHFRPTSGVKSQFAIADFDGDSRPDFATVHVSESNSGNTRYWIAFQLSGGSRQTLGITAPAGGVQLTSGDVNGDDFVDVIVTTAWTNLPVAVLLNDGKGNFTASSPSDFLEVFLELEKSWTFTSPEIKDAFALVLTRYFTGDCEDSHIRRSPVNIAKLLAEKASDRSALAPIVSFSGRAPPSSVFCL
jgi:hypothetical protein